MFRLQHPCTLYTTDGTEVENNTILMMLEERGKNNFCIRGRPGETEQGTAFSNSLESAGGSDQQESQTSTDECSTSVATASTPVASTNQSGRSSRVEDRNVYDLLLKILL